MLINIADKNVDLERQRYGVLVNFLRFEAAVHISKVNCAKIAGNRSKQPALNFSHKT